MSASASAPDLVHVRLLRLPVDVYRETRERHEGLMREFALLAVQEERDTDSVPSRLLSFGEDLRRRYSAFTGAPQQRLEEALERGEESVDLHYQVPAGAADAAEGYIELLDEVDAFCREGDLLTLAPTPEVITFRTWFLGEFVRQLRGEPPVPWEVARRTG